MKTCLPNKKAWKDVPTLKLHAPKKVVTVAKYALGDTLKAKLRYANPNRVLLTISKTANQ